MAGDTVSPAWTFCFFDCAAPDMDAGERKQHRKSALRIGTSRELHATNTAKMFQVSSVKWPSCISSHILCRQ